MQQKVDPFIPVTNKLHPAANRQKQKPVPTRSRSVDGITPRSRLPYEPRRSQVLTRNVRYEEQPPQPSGPTFTYAPAAQPTQQPLPNTSKHRVRAKKIAVTALQIVGLLVLFGLGFLVRSVAVGQLLIVCYALLAFVFRLESRVTFALALMSLVVVFIANIRSDASLAHSFGAYAFLLLAIGTLCLGREVKNEW